VLRPARPGRLDFNRLPASQRHKRHDRRWQRYEKPLPGHRVQIDVKSIAPLAGSRRKHYQFTTNGAEFQSQFHYHVPDKGIGHDYIKPRTPRLYSKVERSHRDQPLHIRFLTLAHRSIYGGEASGRR
jgi:hypothetical protein